MSPRRLADAPAPLLVVGAAFSVQGGAALATSAFDDAGPLGFVWLRVAFAALLLAALSSSSWHRLRSLPLGLMLATGASVALMNACFYQAIDRIPLGSAVTVEFLGPLGVAVAGSRRALDFLWIGSPAAASPCSAAPARISTRSAWPSRSPRRPAGPRTSSSRSGSSRIRQSWPASRRRSSWRRSCSRRSAWPPEAPRSWTAASCSPGS